MAWSKLTFLFPILALSSFHVVFSNESANSSVLDYITNAVRNQRELSGSIPIDHIGIPATPLRLTHFGNINYSVSQIKTIPNVINNGYRRLILDIYWNNQTRQWQLCPFAQLNSNNISTVTNSSSPDVLINNVICPSSAFGQFDFVVSSISSWFQQSMSKFYAEIIYLILNVHNLNVITTGTNITTSTDPISLSTILRQSFSDLLYTPLQLSIDRSNLNASWGYSLYYNTFPAEGATNANPIIATDNGWPPGEYLLNNGKPRLLVGFNGTFSRGIADYDFAVDNQTIFDFNVLHDTLITTDQLSDLKDGLSSYTPQSCAKPGNGLVMISTGSESGFNTSAALRLQLNPVPWSFAIITGADALKDDSRVNEIASCGYSTNFLTQQDKGSLQGTVWSWAEIQPVNGSSHCALMRKSDGRW